MPLEYLPSLAKPQITKRSIKLGPQDSGFIQQGRREESPSNLSPRSLPNLDSLEVTDECTALVVNSSHQTAKEITFGLTLKMPNCSIMYAPSLQLAKWILVRRQVDLIVSDGILPDGCVTGLLPELEKAAHRPDLVVVGNISLSAAEKLRESGYHFTSLRHMGEVASALTRESVAAKDEKVKELGKDIRNDLNNPLQEIVAMVFVAQASGGASTPALQALDAIDRAAKNMSVKIRGLEDRIRKVVEP